MVHVPRTPAPATAGDPVDNAASGGQYVLGDFAYESIEALVDGLYATPFVGRGGAPLVITVPVVATTPSEICTDDQWQRQ